MRTRFRNGIDRRQFLAGSAITAGVLAAPGVLRAAPSSIKIGLIHPVTGALAYSGTQCRAGGELAISDINAAGGIKSLGGAKLEAILGDSLSKPDVGASETAKAIEAGACGIVAGYASAITLATSQEAAKTNTPHVVDVGVTDTIVTRGLKNTFRFSPGYGKIASDAVTALAQINKDAGSPAKTVVIVHEDSAFGAGTAKLLSEKLPEHGFKILAVISHPTPMRDFTNIALQIKSVQPDIVIPANYYNEYVLLARTIRQQQVKAKAIYSVLGGAASSFKFVKDFPQAAEGVMDCNHWYNPKSDLALARKAAVEAKGLFYTYEVYLTYNAVALLADAIERAGSTDKEKVIAALNSSTWDKHGMPYGLTRFVNGQNEGAQPVNTQVQNGKIDVIRPAEFASAKPIFPLT
ncbi:ABC transporter substrate-binding protein [Allorhizobium sp. BGMRC 0089]|uniref:ABC transporter substrate-binding protein n=1 Tax=Allorhizobium sonneratiae TaxID=2934936 RepID=UPI002033EB9E|nr:ABC transporter substrate-binding protein [Allorhizobium sonneratiae]MCM2292428.1 ABC transporter substrate-binding protein [Allorhizobium sonneratiae]